MFPKVTVQYGEPISFPVVAEPTREQAAGRLPSRSSTPVKAMYAALEERGRGSVIKSLREGAAAAATPPSDAQAHS